LAEERIEHAPEALREFLAAWEPRSPVEVETVGNWYWIVDAIEHAGCQPRLVHANKAKLMLRMVNKGDNLDVRSWTNSSGSAPCRGCESPGSCRSSEISPACGWY